MAETDAKLRMLRELKRRVLWLATWTVHHANHLRHGDEAKIGGHQASGISTVAALYRHHGIDINAILHAARAVSAGRTIRYLRALP